MATVTLPHFDATPTFQDIVATIAGAGSVDVEIQNVGGSEVEIITRASGGVPPNTTGLILRPREGYNFNAAQIWVRSLSGRNSRVSLTTTG